MKLYMSPGACSQACHIALREAGLAFTPVRVTLGTRKLEDGGDFLAINPKGYVPVLELDTGERLTEVPVVLQYIADLAPSKNLIPAAGSMARYRVMEWLSYTSSELHKAFNPLFSPSASDEAKARARETVLQRLALAEQHLDDREYLVGETYSVADIFLFVVAGWGRFCGVDLSGMPHLSAYLKRIVQRPEVQAALQAERSKG